MTTTALQAALPDYEVTQELGRGAMGIVYLGRHRALDRTVAIKELPPSFAVDPEVRERFLTEARVVAALDHPHIVVIHDFVDRDGHLALVMEHLPNGTVWDQFLHHGLAAPRACGLALATLAGVHHAHERGIMHRDIKPENLIFTHDWQLKVTDFGIAQVLTGRETMGTLEGAIVGTPAYMSPEQAEGRPCGPQADVYAVGAMLYEMLTGSLPFPNATSAMAMALARLTEDPVPIRSVGPVVPGAIAEVTMQALTRSEAERFPTAEAFGVALGKAAADTWGPEWMSESGTAVRGSEAIEQASRTTGGSPKRRGADELDDRETRLDDALDDRETQLRAEGAGGADDRETRLRSEGADGVDDRETRAGGTPNVPVADNRPTSMQTPADIDTRATQLESAAQTAVIPQQRSRVAGADLHNLAPQDMLNLSEVRSPPSPVLPALLAALGLAAMLYLAGVGFGTDPEPSDGSAAVVQGVAAAQADEPIEVDLTEPIGLTGVSDSSLSASFLGIPLGSASVSNGVFDPGYLQYSAGGVIELANSSGETFPVRSSNSVYLTAPFVGAAMVALGGLGSVNSNLRGMRSRRLRVAPYLGLIISGAITGAGLAVLGMLVLATPTAVSSVVAAAATGAVGCLALGEAYRRWRRRRRLRRITIATGKRG